MEWALIPTALVAMIGVVIAAYLMGRFDRGDRQ